LNSVLKQYGCNLIATAISELTRNIIRYAKEGEIVFTRPAIKAKLRHCRVRAIRSGNFQPGASHENGIFDFRQFGNRLPGVERLMDEFNIDSRPGHVRP